MPKLQTIVIPVKGDSVLLGLKKRGFGAGRWNGFGGKVENGEDIDGAAMRELREECGLVANKLENFGLIEFSFQGLSDTLVVHFFQTVDFDGEPEESEEMKPQWFSTAEIPFDKMWPDDKYWFPIFLQNKKFKGEFLFDKRGGDIVGYNLTEV